MQISISNAIGSGSSQPRFKKLVKLFKARVLADNGIFEAEECLKTQIKELL